MMSIGFTVTIVPEAAKNGVRLCDAWMQFDGDASGVGSYAEVIEHLIAPPAEEMVGALEVYDRVTLEGDEITRRKDALEFCGPDGFGAVSSLIVEKTATFFARPVGGVASASLIEQRFSEVPSPGALALAGLAGLIGSRRQRS
jgi:MYXO-CTERM domain-containing protein